jgi:hypothetical protein
MTGRHKGYVVILDRDIREDDAERIVQAIQMVKGVLDVKPIVADHDDLVNRSRIRHELLMKVIGLLKEEFP